jgi:ABC-type proline/glycine betaine transport system substrate-binding protein
MVNKGTHPQMVLIQVNEIWYPDSSRQSGQGEWLKENPERWESWLPNETACTSGKGLVNGSLGG